MVDKPTELKYIVEQLRYRLLSKSENSSSAARACAPVPIRRTAHSVPPLAIASTRVFLRAARTAANEEIASFDTLVHAQRGDQDMLESTRHTLLKIHRQLK